MSTDYLQDLLSDTESYMIEARKGNLRAAHEALDTVNFYQSLRADDEGEEPWLAADAYAGDMETEAIELIEKLTGRGRPRAKTCKDYGCNSWACWLLGFHIKGPYDD